MNITEVNQNTDIKQRTELSPKATNKKGEIIKKSFSQLMDSIRSTETSGNILNSGNKAMGFEKKSFADPRLPGDFISSFKIENPTPADSHSEVQGMARNYGKSGDIIQNKQTIDRTSKLYEQSLELESYFVKIMLSSMRKTLSGKNLMGDTSFAGKMYEDMIYDERARTMTKNAGFGLADQIYLQLSKNI